MTTTRTIWFPTDTRTDTLFPGYSPVYHSSKIYSCFQLGDRYLMRSLQAGLALKTEPPWLLIMHLLPCLCSIKDPSHVGALTRLGTWVIYAVKEFAQLSFILAVARPRPIS